MAGNIKGITIEIGGDTSKLDKALNSINKTSREVNKELREINKSLKFNPGNTDLLVQKQRALGTAIENTKQKLEKLKVAQEQAQQALARGDLGQDEYDALSREILKTENQLKSLEGQLNTLNSKWAQTGQALQDAGKKLQNIGKSVTDIGQALTTRLTLPLTAIGTAAGKLAVDFESAMAGVAKTVDMTESEFEAMSQAIRDMAKEIPATTTEIAAVAEAAGQLGIEKENILAFTRTMIDLGESTNLTADQAATAFARFANITQMPQDSFDRLGSAVVALGNNFATTESEIVEMGMRLAATGSQIGLTEAETMGLATALSSVGVQAEAGGTAMSTVMTKINKAVGEGGTALQEFAQISGMTAEQFAQLWKSSPSQAIEQFVQGLSTAQETGQNLDTVLADLGITGIRETDTMKRLAGAGDLLAEAFGLATSAFEENTALATEAEQRYATMAAQMDIAKNKLMDIGITIGNIVMPYVMQLVDYLSGLSDKFAELDPKIQENIVKFGAFVAAIGPILIVLGTLTTAIGSIISGLGVFASAFGVAFQGAVAASTAVKTVATVMTSLSGALGVAKAALLAIVAAITSPIAGFIALGAAITALTVLVVKNWDEIKNKTSQMWKTVQTEISQIVDGIKAKVTEAFNTIANNVKSSLEKTKSDVSAVWNAIKSTLESIWNSIKSSATTAFNGIKSAIDTVWNALKSSTSSIWNGIKSAIDSVWNNIKSSATSTFNNIKSTIDSAWNSIKSSTTSVWNTIKSSITNAINTAKDAVSSAISTMRSLLSGSLPFPKIKLPRFSVSGSFSLNPPSVPSFGVSWYKEGGIFNSPSLIGVGEAGSEAVIPTHKLDKFLEEGVNRVSSRISGGGSGDILITGNTFNVREDEDIRRIAEEIYKMQQRNSRGRGLVTT